MGAVADALIKILKNEVEAATWKKAVEVALEVEDGILPAGARVRVRQQALGTMHGTWKASFFWEAYGGCEFEVYERENKPTIVDAKKEASLVLVFKSKSHQDSYAPQTGFWCPYAWLERVPAGKEDES